MDFVITHIYREGNRVANCLASRLLSLSLLLGGEPVQFFEALLFFMMFAGLILRSINFHLDWTFIYYFLFDTNNMLGMGLDDESAKDVPA